MRKNPELLSELEDRFIRDEIFSFDQAIKIFTSMWNEGKNLGVLPPKDPLEGIEVDIRVAKVLNSCLKKRSHA
jgi:hypothetical protein